MLFEKSAKIRGVVETSLRQIVQGNFFVEMRVDIVQNILRNQLVLVAILHENLAEDFAQNHVNIRIQNRSFPKLK